MKQDRIHPLAPGAETVHRLAKQLGFALLGIAGAEPSAHAEAVREWLAAGKHGEMAYLADRLEDRLDPRKFVPGARSIICVADRYGEARQEGGGKRQEEKQRSEPPDSALLPPASCLLPLLAPASCLLPAGKIARYAWGDDYHVVLRKRLDELAAALGERWPEHQFKPMVDTGALLEREHAARAGLGWVGKHTLLIHPQLGSWLLLGEIVTTLPLQTSAEAGRGPVADHCGTCTRCIDACPTGCITPHSVDASRCISYLTLEHRGPVPPDLQAQMGDWIAGCDVCQEVCPFNQIGQRHEGTEARPRSGHEAEGGLAPPHPAYTLRPPAPAIPLLELLGWDEPARQRAFVKSALKRVKLAQLKRNALIAAGNHLSQHADAALRARVEAIAADPSEPELVRLTARQVIDRLGAPSHPPARCEPAPAF